MSKIRKKIIIEATGCSEEDAAKIETCMRETIFHSTLDWQTKEQLAEAAKQAQTILIEAGEMLRPLVQPAKLGRGSRFTRKQVRAAVKAVAEQDDNHCDEAEDGKHVPDPESISPRSSQEPVVDINCKLCGQSGSVTIKPEDILW
jgi:hypothetical protein